MKRRTFLKASMATAALAAAREGAAQPSAASSAREYYQIRRYQLQAGPQTKIVESYFGDALIPALTRMGMGPIGAFKLDYGPETQTRLKVGTRVCAMPVLISARGLEAVGYSNDNPGTAYHYLEPPSRTKQKPADVTPQ